MKHNDDYLNELKELVALYEQSLSDHKAIYMDTDQLADIANWYCDEKLYDKAHEVINYGLKLHPENTKLQLEQAFLHLDCLDFKQAQEVVETICDQEIVEVKLIKAEIAMNEGKVDEACSLIDTIEIEEKSEREIIENVVRFYLDMGYPIKSYEWLKTIKERHGESKTINELLANTCFHCRDKINEAIDLYNHLIDNNPYNAKYWTELAKCYFQEENYNLSLEAIDFALTVNEKYGDAYSVKANTFLQINESDEAIKLYEKAIEFKGISPYFAYVFLGLTFVNEQNWQKGIEFLEKALSNAPSGDDPGIILYSGIYSNLSLAYCMIEDYDKAEQMCDKSLELESETPHTHIVIGLILLGRGDTENAERAFKDAFELDNSIDTILQAADYAFNYRHYSYAKQLFEEVYNRDSKHPGICHRLASISVVFLDAVSFCKYNDMLDNPIAIDSIVPQYIKEDDPDSIKAYQEFIESISNHQKQK